MQYIIAQQMYIVEQHSDSALSSSLTQICTVPAVYRCRICYLMLWAYTIHLQHLCQFVQTTMEVVTELHQIFDVIYSRKVDLQ